MLAKEIKDKYPLIWQTLMEIIACDDTGQILEHFIFEKSS